jgi:HK97 family phage prohead protease
LENIYNKKPTFLSCSIKDVDPKREIVTGYFASFGNKDSDGDIILKGAFNRTIEERGPASTQPRIKHLLNHKVDMPLGQLITLKEDDKGLYYESKMGGHTIAKEFVLMVESGLITEHSIGFRTVQSEKDKNDSSTNYLKEVQLWEGSSLTSWGANHQTPLTGMKSAEKEKYLQDLINKQTAIERFCRNSTVSDETFELLLLSNKQLSQLIIDLTKETSGPAQTGTIHPDNKAEGDNCEDVLKNIYSLFPNSNYPRDGTTRLKKGLRAYT